MASVWHCTRTSVFTRILNRAGARNRNQRLVPIPFPGIGIGQHGNSGIVVAISCAGIGVDVKQRPYNGHVLGLYQRRALSLSFAVINIVLNLFACLFPFRTVYIFYINKQRVSFLNNGTRISVFIMESVFHGTAGSTPCPFTTDVHLQCYTASSDWSVIATSDQ